MTLIIILLSLPILYILYSLFVFATSGGKPLFPWFKSKPCVSDYSWAYQMMKEGHAVKRIDDWPNKETYIYLKDGVIHVSDNFGSYPLSLEEVRELKESCAGNLDWVVAYKRKND